MSSIPTTPKPDSSEIYDDRKGEEQKKQKSVPLQWSDQIESLLAGWADTAAVYKWLHDKSHRKYKRKNQKLAIPTMILSLVTGSLGIGLNGYVPPEYMSIGQGALGGMGILIGILQGLQTQFGWAQRSERHSGSCVGWGKLHRNISIELAVEREHRKDCDSFVKVCRMEYDRLTEQSPAIPSDVLELWNTTFKKKYITNEKSETNDELILPDICDSIKHTKIYKVALDNPDNLIPNVYDVAKSTSDDSADKQNTDKIIKDALNERMKSLEEKISGVNQYKLSVMGNRFAPIDNIIRTQITERHDHDKHNIVHPIKNDIPRRYTEFEGIKPVNISPNIEKRVPVRNNSLTEKPKYGFFIKDKPKIENGIELPNVKKLIEKFSKKPELEDQTPSLNNDNNVEVIIDHNNDSDKERTPVISSESLAPLLTYKDIPPLDLSNINIEEKEDPNIVKTPKL